MTSYKNIVLCISVLCLFQATQVFTSETEYWKKRCANVEATNTHLAFTNLLHKTEQLNKQIIESNLEPYQKSALLGLNVGMVCMATCLKLRNERNKRIYAGLLS